MIEQMYVISITLTIFTKGKRKDRQLEKNLKEKKKVKTRRKNKVSEEKGGWFWFVSLPRSSICTLVMSGSTIWKLQV